LFDAEQTRFGDRGNVAVFANYRSLAFDDARQSERSKIPVATSALIGSPMKRLLVCAGLASLLLAPLAAIAQIGVSITIVPPALPVYAQPVVPGDGYIWTPGYWNWNPTDSDYYWVPGTWVLAPAAGELWTPGYWGYEDSGYRWHGGYWGNEVGFYGGIDYGYGYGGSGYQGGRWQNGAFQYNQAVSNVNVRVVHNVYSERVVNRVSVNHVSFNGGKGGVSARPTAAQASYASAPHRAPTGEQVEHEHAAMSVPAQRASVSHGAPKVAATPKPSAFSGPGVETARARPAVAQARPAPAPAPHAAPRQAEAPAERAPARAPERAPEHAPVERAPEHAAAPAPARAAPRAEHEPAREETPRNEK